MMYSIQPYLATDTLRLKGGEKYHGNRIYIGANYNFTENISVTLERTIASTRDRDPDTTFMTFYLNF